MTDYFDSINAISVGLPLGIISAGIIFSNAVNIFRQYHSNNHRVDQLHARVYDPKNGNRVKEVSLTTLADWSDEAEELLKQRFMSRDYRAECQAIVRDIKYVALEKRINTKKHAELDIRKSKTGPIVLLEELGAFDDPEQLRRVQAQIREKQQSEFEARLHAQELILAD